MSLASKRQKNGLTSRGSAVMSPRRAAVAGDAGWTSLRSLLNHRSELSVFVGKPQTPAENYVAERALSGPVIGGRHTFGSDGGTGAHHSRRDPFAPPAARRAQDGRRQAVEQVLRPLPLPSDPGEVYADSAYRGRRFAAAVRARAGTPRIAAVGVWARFDPASQREAERWLAERNRAIHRIRWRDLANAHLQARLTATAFSLTRTGNLLAAV